MRADPSPKEAKPVSDSTKQQNMEGFAESMMGMEIQCTPGKREQWSLYAAHGDLHWWRAEVCDSVFSSRGCSIWEHIRSPAVVLNNQQQHFYKWTPLLDQPKTPQEEPNNRVRDDHSGWRPHHTWHGLTGKENRLHGDLFQFFFIVKTTKCVRDVVDSMEIYATHWQRVYRGASTISFSTYCGLVPRLSCKDFCFLTDMVLLHCWIPLDI